jgi:hypothetical protein
MLISTTNNFLRFKKYVAAFWGDFDCGSGTDRARGHFIGYSGHVAEWRVNLMYYYVNMTP